MIWYEWFAIGLGVATFLYVWRILASAMAWGWDQEEKRRQTRNPCVVGGITVGFFMTALIPIWGPIYGVVWMCENTSIRQLFIDHVLVAPKELVKEPGQPGGMSTPKYRTIMERKQ